MGQMRSSWAELGILLASLSIAFAAGFAQAQTSPPPGDQSQAPEGAASPGPQAPVPSTQQAVDPFAGSPALQMFERPRDVSNAAAPARLIPYAPLQQEPTPLGVRFFMTAEEEFTDNTNETKDNRKSEFRTHLVPGVAVRADRPSLIFSLAYAPDVLIRENSIGDTQLEHNAMLHATLWPQGKFQINVSDYFNQSHDFRTLNDPGSLHTGTSQFSYNEAAADMGYAFPNLRVALGYTNIFVKDDSLADTRLTHIARPTAEYTTPRFTLGGAYALTRGDLDSNITPPYWGNAGNGWFRYVVTPTFTAGLVGSYGDHDVDASNDQDFTLARARATSTFVLGPGGLLQAEAGADSLTFKNQSRKVRPSFLVSYTQRLASFDLGARFEQGFREHFEDVDASSITFTRSAGIFVSSPRLFFRDVSGMLTLLWEENEFLANTALGGNPGRKDRNLGVEMEIRYYFVRQLSFLLGYAGWFRHSNQSENSFFENRIRIGLTFEYNLL